MSYRCSSISRTRWLWPRRWPRWRRTKSRSAARSLRDSAFDQRDSGARVDQESSATAGHHHATRHGHHFGRRRSFVSADYEIWAGAIRRRHGDFELSEAINDRALRIRSHRSHPELCLSGRLQAEDRLRVTRSNDAGRRAGDGSCFELPARQETGGLR